MPGNALPGPADSPLPLGYFSRQCYDLVRAGAALGKPAQACQSIVSAVFTYTQAHSNTASQPPTQPFCYAACQLTLLSMWVDEALQHRLQRAIPFENAHVSSLETASANFPCISDGRQLRELEDGLPGGGCCSF